MLLITSTDEYLGYCLTSHLSQFQLLRNQLRVLIHKTDKKNVPPYVSNFSKKGIDVCAVDYLHPNDLSRAFKNVDQMILTVGNHPDRVQHCKHLCQVAVRSGVRSIVLLSHIGAHSEQHVALRDYGCIETYLVQQHQACEQPSFQWTILRLDWIQQFFHLWACQVESKRSLYLPLAFDTEICPVDISDVCTVVTSLVTQQDETTTFVDLEDKHCSQLYTITGIESASRKDLTRMLITATQYEHMECHLTRPMDTAFYLKTLGHNIWFDERIKREKSRIFSDKLDQSCSYRQNILIVPNDVQIQTFLDYFDWANKTSGSFPIDDIHLLMKGKQPSSILQFFTENANSFKPRV